MRLGTTLLCVLFSLGINGLAADYADKEPSQRERRELGYFHDDIVKLGKSPNSSKVSKNSSERFLRGTDSQTRYLKTIKLLPADNSLRHDFYSENVENRLGRILIQRRNRRDDSNKKTNQSVPASVKFSDPPMPINAINDNAAMRAARVQDIEEIFIILARRDGQFLEQMLTLRAAIDRMYSIFEFNGVAKMPPDKRDAAIRKIIRMVLNIDRRKRKRKRRIF